MRARVSSRLNARMHVYASCARMCAWIFTKNLLKILNYILNKSVKFHIEPSLFCEFDLPKSAPAHDVAVATRRHARFVATKRARARLRFVCARVCMDLNQKKNE